MPWALLKMECPVANCNGTKGKKQWTHADGCGEKSYINEKAVVECYKGGRGHSYEFKDWRWKCSDGKHGYEEAGRLFIGSALREALKGASAFADSDMGDDWLFSLCANLGKQCLFFCNECNIQIFCF